MATKPGKVIAVTKSSIQVDNKSYPIIGKTNKFENADKKILILPTKESWHEVLVKPGDMVTKKQLLAQGNTRIYFQANMWVFICLIMLIGMTWGVGTIAVFKHIPDYFPDQIGMVGGMVGLIGGMGGFVGPILFGYLLSITGLWTSAWMFICILSLICIIWRHQVVTSDEKKRNGTVK
ncbi:hypothetical protein GCM10027049_11060 [Mucilaginibacter puniceus]